MSKAPPLMLMRNAYAHHSAALTRLWDSTTNTPPSDHIGQFSWRPGGYSCCCSAHISGAILGSSAGLLWEAFLISTRREESEEGVYRSQVTRSFVAIYCVALALQV